MNEPRKVFLETTIMIDRLCKDNETKSNIGEILSNYDKTYTSNYARMEFKRGFLQNLVYLHGKVALCRNLTEVLEAISKLSATPQRHLLGSILENIKNFYRNIYQTKPSEIIEKYGDISIDEYLKEMAESYLSNLIRSSWRRFDKVVDEVINPMECFVDIKSPRKVERIYDNTPRTCDKSKYKCEIRRFFNNNPESFSKILKSLQDLTNLDTETTKRIRSLKEILRLRKKDIMPKDCWNCSDAIMAVEAPHDSDIFNNNQKHYIPICDVLSKQSVGYDSLLQT
jgi:hypothetical protein